MAIAQLTETISSIATVSGTELSMITGAAGPVSNSDDTILSLSFAIVSAVAADSFQVTVYKTIDGTQYPVQGPYLFVGVQSAGHEVDPGACLTGYDVTIKKLTGTDRAVKIVLHKVIPPS